MNKQRRNNRRKEVKKHRPEGVKNWNQPKCKKCGAVRRKNYPHGRNSRGVSSFTHSPMCGVRNE